MSDYPKAGWDCYGDCRRSVADGITLHRTRPKGQPGDFMCEDCIQSRLAAVLRGTNMSDAVIPHDGWIYGREAACRFIARTAWPWEATENRDSWAPRIGDEPEFGRKELALAHRRLDQAAETLGLGHE